MSFLIGFEPTLRAPLVERYFEFYSADDRTDLDSRDGGWGPYPMQRPEQRALLGQTLSALSSLCELYHDISAWNYMPSNHAPLGSQHDIAFRVQMFRKLDTWDANLNPSLRTSTGSMAHSYYIKSVRTFPSRMACSLLPCENVILTPLDSAAVFIMPPTSRYFVLYRSLRTPNFLWTLARQEISASSTP